LSVTGEPERQMVPRFAPQPVAAGVKEKGIPTWLKEPTGSVTDPFEFKPTMPPDGIAGIGVIKPDNPTPGDPGNLSFGKRTGAMSFYVDEGRLIRIKEDIRINMPFMSEKDINGQISPLKNLVTSHFRTSKPIIRTKMLDKTFDPIETGFDGWAEE
jgi:hypothetical protein